MTVLAPLAAASGTVNTPPLYAEIDNGHDADCVEEVSGLCPFSGDVGEGENAEFDLEQRLNYVGVAVNDSAAEELVGFELLPDQSIRFYASSLYREHPFFVLLFTATGGEVQAPGPAQGFVSIMMNERGVVVRRPLVDPGSPSSGVEPGETRFDFGGFLGYDQIGPFHGLAGFSSDALVVNQLRDSCHFVLEDQCADLMGPLADAWTENTPALRYGVEIYEAAVATAPELLARTDSTSPKANERGELLRSQGPDSLSEPLRLGTPMDQVKITPAPRSTPPPNGIQEPKRSEATLMEDSPKLAMPENPDNPLIIPLTAAFALAVLAAVLYSRLKREDLIQAPHRARILAALEERGPLRLAELARLVGVDRTTVCYHAELLGRAGLVQTLRAGRSAYLGLPRQKLPPSSRAGGELGVAVRELLALHGGALPRAQVHEMLPGVPQRTRNYALRQLLAAGAVLETPSEGGTLLSLAR